MKKLICHPELVSGSDQIGIYVSGWENAEISRALPSKPPIAGNKRSCKFKMT